MNIAKLKMSGAACIYFLFIAFSASVNAADLDSGPFVEGWSTEGGRDIPILSFDGMPTDEESADDIRAEGFIQEKPGSVRFKLSHNGPLSRQVFANVRTVEQENGVTRSIITNIADGSQMEYLTRAPRLPWDKKVDKGGDGDLMAQLAVMEDQNTECPWCIPVLVGVGVAVVTSALMCMKNRNLFYENCRMNCQVFGGIQTFRSGVCGTVNAECICMTQPKLIQEDVPGGFLN